MPKLIPGSKLEINTYNLLVVIFVALGTLSTAYGLAIIGSTVGQPNCEFLIRFKCNRSTDNCQSTPTSTSQPQANPDMITRLT